MIYTAGHSTHPPEAFLRVVTPAGPVVDVRSHRSSKWPWFHADPMQAFVQEGGHPYEWEPRLGGWDVRHAADPAMLAQFDAVGVDLRAYSRGAFPKQRIGRQVRGDEPSEEGKPVWTNRGLLDYAWFTTTPEFQEGAAQLAARTDNPVIICAEALWWKCHRSMVADYLVVVHGVRVVHLMPTAKGGPRQSDHAVRDRFERYPLAVQRSWRSA